MNEKYLRILKHPNMEMLSEMLRIFTSLCSQLTLQIFKIGLSVADLEF